jgi:hypothetical protein
VSEPWIPVGALAAAFAGDTHRLPPSAALAGRTLRLSFEDGSHATYRFLDAATLSVSDGDAGRVPRDLGYDAVEPRPGIFLVDHIDPDARAGTRSLVLDFHRGACTLVVGRLPTHADARIPLLARVSAGRPLTGVEARCTAGAIGVDWSAATARHPPTARLVGRRIRYRYSPTESYEHVYLNERFYTWHCLEGAERGLADTDQCWYREIGDALYLFCWQEKIVPTLGLVLVDLRERRTCGKILGYAQNGADALANFPVGARIVDVE